MVAANLGLRNLFVVVDSNSWGGMDRVPVQFPALMPLVEKFAAFGWSARLLPGHDRLRGLVDWLRPEKKPLRPRVAVCRTVKGRGVSFIEDGQPLWHYRSPTAEEYDRAVRELDEGARE